jgi:uncharacterized protein (TIGR04141 family)
VKQPTNKLSLHRLKDLDAFEHLDPTGSGYRLEHEDGETKLFIQSTKSSPPHWFRYVASLVSSPKEQLLNTSCSFLLLRKFNGTTYAVTGGYAHNEVRGAAVDDFGIQVALRMLDDDGSIATISQRSMKGTTRQLLRAVAGYDPQLDRDNYNRILQALEGKASFEGRRFSIKGREALTLRTSRSVSELDDVLRDVEQILARSPRVSFPRSYTEITDPSEIDALDKRLVADFSSFWRGVGSRDDIYLEFSDPLAQFRCDEFEIRWDRKCHTSPDFDLGRVRDGLIGLGTRVPASLEDLTKIRVTGINEFGHVEFGPEPFLRMLIYETSMDDGASRIRLGGKWLRILDDLQTFLDEELGKLTVYTNLLPAWDKKQFPSENDYNKYAAKTLGWNCLDRELISLEGRSKIEVCDIFDLNDPRFIHVKETWGAKAAYLFSQGLIAGEFYSNSQGFREACAAKWPSLFTERVEHAEVVFAIASPNALANGFPLNLSYFAKVSLYDACVRLRALEYRVALTGVDVNP